MKVMELWYLLLRCLCALLVVLAGVGIVFAPIVPQMLYQAGFEWASETYLKGRYSGEPIEVTDMYDGLIVAAFAAVCLLVAIGGYSIGLGIHLNEQRIRLWEQRQR